MDSAITPKASSSELVELVITPDDTFTRLPFAKVVLDANGYMLGLAGKPARFLTKVNTLVHLFIFYLTLFFLRRIPCTTNQALQLFVFLAELNNLICQGQHL